MEKTAGYALLDMLNGHKYVVLGNHDSYRASIADVHFAILENNGRISVRQKEPEARSSSRI